MRRDLGVPDTWGTGMMAIFPPGPSAIFDAFQSGPRNINVAPPLPSEPTNTIVCPPNFPAVTAYADSRETKDLLLTCTSHLREEPRADQRRSVGGSTGLLLWKKPFALWGINPPNLDGHSTPPFRGGPSL